jgi:hypothetical protein
MVAGGIRHNDIVKTSLDEILANNTMIPKIQGVNLTAIKDQWLDAASKQNKDHTTMVLVGSCIFFLIWPLICICFSRSAVANNSSARMTCICCFEGLVGWSRFLCWFIPLATAASVCFYLKDDKDFLKCTEIVPWVQGAVTDAAVGAVTIHSTVNNKTTYVNASLLAIVSPHVTLTGVIKEILKAGNVTEDIKQSFLNEISKRLNATRVDQLSKAWLAEFKTNHPGAQPLSTVTEDYFDYMFNATNAEQMSYCTSAVNTLYKYAGILGGILAVFAAVAACEVGTCCFGSCEAWQAKNTLSNNQLFVGLPMTISEDTKPLMSREVAQTIQPQQQRNGGLACCSSLGTCGRR